MSKTEKILVYNHIFFLISETFVYQQSRDLARNFEVHVLAKEFRNPHEFDCSMFNMHNVRRPTSLAGRALGKAVRMLVGSSLEIDLRSFFRLRKAIKKNKYKAIHAHFGPNALDIMGYAKAYGIPLVPTFHGHDASRLLKNEKYKNRLPELFEYASAIIVVSRHMIKNLELEPWIEKVHIIPCSVDPEKFVITKNGRASDKIKIVHSGRIVSTKGVPDLVTVFTELADKYENIELHIAGDGEQLPDARELAEGSRHSEKITFYGRVSQKQVNKLLNDSDIFVLNSRTDENGDMEGTPVSILEAMCLKKPVVSTIHAGIPDVIQHGENGMLAHEYANDELYNCIEQLIQDADLRKRLGARARTTVEQSYTTTVMNQKLQDIFTSL
ncbi:MAG: glycosyltransferase family 4 protein [Balneolaceae bacterium]|nr:glycosyltransferase family 4 protein [Balneolaceae bacterium]